jgi:copper chaperone CopZ
VTTTTTTLQVEGMTCGHCEQAVRSELSAVPGVHTVDVDLASGRVVVHGEGLDGSALRGAVEEAGYGVA